ncbi:hypothetical protein FYC62_02605 [Pedobacter aquae]|uniref:Uncharacterized protein n=1 Tax=Pedobacter aquae TaxID=2605747 RepID=A0A5C0VE08_9SPHI|nr:hypothetical protein [Pedobacter aquae]QEK50676.1 hypothetical protein FYC62_02605 [Pedobacter aquae]
MDQIALNTVIAVMMAIFPGFIFRKCYYTGEFTKQFNQSTEFDKLLWNVFFSSISIGLTFLLIYLFRGITGLKVLDSLSYETIHQLSGPIANNQIPKKDIISKTYKDLLVIVGLIYFFSCFFGLTLHWLVKTLRLDIWSPLFRFKNYWYYYIHGGKILYNNPENKKLAFTKADVLCEIGGETKLYSGILSQYTVNKEDNNLENIFLTNAQALKQIKDADGNTTAVKARNIPGAVFCIPYHTVLNMNLVYVYRNTESKNFQKFFTVVFNILFFLCLTFIVVSLWFDLSKYGIVGVWKKAGFAWWSYFALINLRLLIFPKNKFKFSWTIELSFIITALLWILHYPTLVPFWSVIVSLSISIALAVFLQPKKHHNHTSTS